jgi:hypothetical protein
MLRSRLAVTASVPLFPMVSAACGMAADEAGRTLVVNRGGAALPQEPRRFSLSASDRLRPCRALRARPAGLRGLSPSFRSSRPSGAA